jgi:hypothetical protein
MDFATRYIAVGIAQVESGLTGNGWKRFLAASGLTVYRLPGNGRVVDKGELDEAITRVREPLPLDEAVTRE